MKNLVLKSKKGCISVYEHTDLDKITAEWEVKEFFSVSQFIRQPSTLEEALSLGDFAFRKMKGPICPEGSFLYTKSAEGDTIILIKAVIDSGD